MGEQASTFLLYLVINVLRGRPFGALMVFVGNIDLILFLLIGVFAFWLVDKLMYHGGPSRLLKFVVILLSGQAIFSFIPVPLPVKPPHNDASDKQVHDIVPRLARDWAYLAVGLVLTVSPLVFLLITVEEYISFPYLFSATKVYEYWHFFSATVISFFVGLNRFKQFVRSPLIDLCGCFIAFLLYALAAVPWLIAVVDNVFIIGGMPTSEQSYDASVLSFYTALTVIGAIQASRGIGK